jgi:hypothetical protein
MAVPTGYPSTITIRGHTFTWEDDVGFPIQGGRWCETPGSNDNWCGVMDSGGDEVTHVAILDVGVTQFTYRYWFNTHSNGRYSTPTAQSQITPFPYTDPLKSPKQWRPDLSTAGFTSATARASYVPANLRVDYMSGDKVVSSVPLTYRGPLLGVPDLEDSAYFVDVEETLFFSYYGQNNDPPNQVNANDNVVTPQLEWYSMLQGEPFYLSAGIARCIDPTKIPAGDRYPGKPLNEKRDHIGAEFSGEPLWYGGGI